MIEFVQLLKTRRHQSHNILFPELAKVSISGANHVCENSVTCAIMSEDIFKLYTHAHRQAAGEPKIDL